VLSPLLSGFLLGLALITPLGAQNVQVLRAGAARDRRATWGTVAIATSGDVIFILAGGLGLSAVLTGHRWVEVALFAFGAVLLGRLAWESVKDFRAGGNTAESDAAERDGEADATVVPGRADRGWLRRILVVTFLNPHVLLDTVAVLGSAAAATGSGARPWFVAGAIAASAVWFVLLAIFGGWVVRRYGARAIRAIDLLSAVVLTIVAVVLAVGAVDRALG